ncbi:hypothetical protein phytr_10740 [Candidatus Phycorickettsia trachydisci]|uniref:Uncharacterized protein n=1 Tax=Candidatus Phycorickettsia trachydisci TaxID=2115978 RepID=A0A2P1P9Q7_9RICK|nr:ankyrin repeat domain-containing protein [Candidatus Phycorickettsia trachydisci]AVP88001.1 hypothetical protein phytr_10740 [Candidatus Phycorickettsia trachydisci]
MTQLSNNLPLHEAIKKNKIKEVDRLLQEAGDDEAKIISISRINKFQQNALHLAAAEHNAAILELLLDANPTPYVLNAQDENGKTPLHYATRDEKSTKCAELLLRKRADINARDFLGNAALHLALKDKDFGMLKFLLSSKANIDIPNGSNYSPLRIAYMQGNEEMIRILLNGGANPNAICDNRDNTLLHINSERNDLSQVQFLLSKGADPNICNKLGYAPLRIAHMQGSGEMMGLLLNNGAKPDTACDDRGNTLLHINSERNNIPNLQFLLSKGANPNIGNCNMETPLHLAIKFGSLDAVRMFLQLPNIKVNRDIYGNTPLKSAIQLGLTKFPGLLDFVPKLFENDDVTDYANVLLALVDAEREDLVKLFLNGSKSDIIASEALELAIENDLAEIAKHFFTYDSQNYELGLRNALKHSNLEAVKYILNKKPELINKRFKSDEKFPTVSKHINHRLVCKDPFSSTPLFIAARESKSEVVEFLLEKWLQYKPQSKKGSAPSNDGSKEHLFLLYIHATYNPDSAEIINFLAKNKIEGIDKVAPDIVKHSALIQAVKNHSYDAIKALLNNGAEVISDKLHHDLNSWQKELVDSSNFLKSIKVLVKHGFDINDRSGLVIGDHSVDFAGYGNNIEAMGLLWSFADAKILSYCINRPLVKARIEEVLKTKNGLLVWANIWHLCFHEQKPEYERFGEELLLKLPKVESNLQEILKQEAAEVEKLSKEITDLIKELNEKSQPQKNDLLEEKINKLFEILYEEEDFYNRAQAMGNKIKDTLKANPIDPTLPQISKFIEQIKVPISSLIQLNIDKYSAIVRKEEGEHPPILSVEGEKNSTLSLMCSFMEGKDLNSFKDIIPLGAKPKITKPTKDKSTKRAKLINLYAQGSSENSSSSEDDNNSLKGYLSDTNLSGNSNGLMKVGENFFLEGYSSDDTIVSKNQDGLMGLEAYPFLADL